ncbi:MAG TPA: SH3 domain-containing protein [Thermomicrobiales bacterium]|nr:SH3 domain-containing protein [Thermomicrobiales bacterium]
MQQLKIQRLSRLLLVACMLCVALAQGVAAEEPRELAVQRDPQAGYNPATNTFRVYAHREGLVGYTTANGHVIQPNDFFVALPCWCSLSSKGGDEFQVRITYKGKSLVVPVWDVGPWNTEDNYWDPPEERSFKGLPRGVPAAEAAYFDGYNGGRDGKGREVRSPAGMDIGDGAFYALGMTDSDWVDVEFLWLDGTLAGPEGPTREEIAASLPPLQPRFSDIATVWWDERPPIDDHVTPIEDGRYGYVPETGHNVPHEILNYWHSHGGWKTLGLPVGEFHRAIERDGDTRYIQHFERAVLELVWPEDGGEPYVVPEDLGYETFIDPDAWEQIEPFQDDGWARYIPDTGHSLGGGFRRVWEAHGGAEVFGLPISEEWGTVAPWGEPVVYQVFERARFEWWPNRAGAGDEITFGLLGLELLLQEGWIEPAPAE